MKNSVKPIIAALLLGSTLLTNAKTLPLKPTIKPFAYSVYKNDGKATINLFINKLKGSKMYITLKNSQGEVIYEDGMNKNDTYYRTKFNLTELNKGIYILEISDGQNTEIKKIEI